MIPLELTAREQSLLALLCQHVGRAIYDVHNRSDPDSPAVIWEDVVKQLGEDVLSGAVLDTHSQEWDVMYDKLHRSGANS